MSKMVTLNNVPLADLPTIAHDLAQGKIEAHAVILPEDGWEFHYIEGCCEPAKRGRYQLQDPTTLCWSLLHPRLTRSELVVRPGLLLNEEHKLFELYHDEVRFNADGSCEQRLDEDGNNIPVDLPARFVQLEWQEVVDKTKEPRGSAGQLVKEYLDFTPTGKLPGLRTWAVTQYGATSIQDNGKRKLQWVDSFGKKQVSPEKTLSNLLSQYRKKPN